MSYSRKVFIPLTHLCRDYCGYCTFRADPQAGVQPYMLPDEVLAVAEAGRKAGCKEALFSLGDQPERIFPEAKEFLKKLGFGRTLEYLAAMSELVLDVYKRQPIDIAACVEFKRVGEDLLGTHVGERADQLYNDSVPEAKMGIPGFRV